jgi:hypothetical protein
MSLPSSLMYTSTPPPPPRQRQSYSVCMQVALDMDGTLLDSQSRVLPSSVKVLKAAIAAGVRVCLATGKARPAAMSALARVGLTGEGLVVSTAGPGIFLQGLAVHSHCGTLLPGAGPFCQMWGHFARSMSFLPGGEALCQVQGPFSGSQSLPRCLRPGHCTSLLSCTSQCAACSLF